MKPLFNKERLFNKQKAFMRLFNSSCSTCFIYSRGFIIITLCLWLGNIISSILPFMIPGSIIGLLTLFFLLVFQLIPTDWIKNSCNLFMRYMTLLFIPAAMGIMDNYVLLLENWAPIIIGSIVGTLIVLVLSAFLTQYLHRTPNQLYLDSSNVDDEEDKKP